MSLDKVALYVRKSQCHYTVTVSFISPLFTFIYLSVSEFCAVLMEGMCTKFCAFGVPLKQQKSLSVVTCKLRLKRPSLLEELATQLFLEELCFKLIGT